MIRLVSQFDNEKMRATVTTPMAGSCCCSSCCCCCCVVSTLGSSIVTARNLGKLVEKQTITSTPRIRKMSKIEAYICGALLLPASIALTFLIFFALIQNASKEYIGIENTIVFFSFAIFLLSFGAGLSWFRYWYGLSRKALTLTFILTIIALIAEFFAWLYILLSFG